MTEITNTPSRSVRVKYYFRLRVISALLDVSAIYCLASIAQSLIYTFTFISFTDIFSCVFIAYYFISYLLMDGRSPAKVFTGLRITGTYGTKAGKLRLFFREVIFKGFIGTWLYLYVLEITSTRMNVVKTAFELLIFLIISDIYLLVFTRTWWEWLSQTITIRDKNTSKARLNYAFLIFALACAGFISVSVSPLLINGENLTNRFLIPYPPTKEVNQYASYIKDHKQDPVDYMFGLFKKYDIVVISERMHPEYSQYEFIFKVINDKRFARLVGNIFTECGSVSYQDSLDNYLHTNYASKDDLDRATARLQRNSNAVWPLWGNTNLFDMFKTVHDLDAVLPDSSRINWYFTDLPVNWETATHASYVKNYTTPHRDSLMAVQVIERYKNVISGQERTKALVIMNTYHGFGLARDGRNYFGGTAAYIMKALPGKVSNVMMNFASMKYLTVFVPVQSGKWDAAFEVAGNPAAGFDFAGSPFGNDLFEGRADQVKGLTYKDVFTGLIFYTPLNKQYCKDGFPFETGNNETELLKRAACVSPGYVESMKHLIEYQKTHPGDPTSTNPLKMPVNYNLIHMVFAPFLMFLLLLTISISFLVKRKKINRFSASRGQ